MSYSADLRKRVVDGYLAGEGSIRGLAARYKVSKNTVVNWLKLHESTGGFVLLQSESDLGDELVNYTSPRGLHAPTKVPPVHS